MTQQELDFDRAIPPIVCRTEDCARLTGQNLAILERLRLGPATTDELSRIGRKYTSRISDIRRAGYRINCSFQDGGNNLYTLTEEPRTGAAN